MTRMPTSSYTYWHIAYRTPTYILILSILYFSGKKPTRLLCSSVRRIREASPGSRDRGWGSIQTSDRRARKGELLPVVVDSWRPMQHIVCTVFDVLPHATVSPSYPRHCRSAVHSFMRFTPSFIRPLLIGYICSLTNPSNYDISIMSINSYIHGK